MNRPIEEAAGGDRQEEKERVLLPASWQVPESFRTRLGNRAGRQRLMEADGHLLLVLHKPPKSGERRRRARLVWRDGTGEWRSSDGVGGPAALQRHLDEFAERLERFEELEARALTADEYLPLLDGLAPIQRAVRNLYEVLRAARTAMPADRFLIDARDNAYDLMRGAELLYNDAKNAMEVAVVRRAEEQAASGRQMALAAHRLNMLAAFFFPLATLAALFGSNLRSGLEDVAPPGPLIALLVAGLLLGGIVVLLTRRRSSAA